MKHANGAGSVTKLKDRKNKPWKAVITKDFVFDAESGKIKQRRKVLGCYRTRTEAEDALADYRRSPYDLDAKKITFAEVYERWAAVHFEKVSDSKIRGYKSAYNHALPLHRLKFKDIRPHHIEKAMADAEVGSATKNNIKVLCGQLYKFAIKNEICSTNYATMCDGVKQDAPTIIRSIFTWEEEAALWQNLDIPCASMVLVGLYSGWRPQELAKLRAEDIDLDAGIMRGGIKTDAGKDRAVPIHSKIYPLIEGLLKDGRKLLFTDDGKPMTYSMYRSRFVKLCERLGFKHTPHDTRHTFITRGKEAGMDDYVLKLIVGHAIGDITEKIYTHRKIDQLKAQIELIKPLEG